MSSRTTERDGEGRFGERTSQHGCPGEAKHNNDHRHRRQAMGKHQLAGLSSSKASLPCPCGGHATTEQALHKDRQQAKRCPDAPPERSYGSSGVKQALGQPTQERHEGERQS